MDHDVTRKKPRKVASRFELAASRMAEACLEAGAVTVSADDLLSAFLLEHQGLIRAALDRCRRGSADIDDYPIGEIARQERASTTYTFDRKLRRAAGFTWLAAHAD